MTSFNAQEHWNKIYSTKKINELSWYEKTPIVSLEYIKKLNLPKHANIIDIGAGDSYLVDHLINLGYTNITILDISEKAIERAQKRLGDLSNQIEWIVGDASNFKSNKTYDLWHDRAAFHFLTQQHNINNYIDLSRQKINSNGYLIIGTFSKKGPEKCSGIPIQQYSKEELSQKFSKHFKTISCFNYNHTTPFDKVQNFSFCCFKKL